MKRFLFKPVNAILEKRQAEADAQFAQAGEKEAQAAGKMQQYEKLLADTETEKEKLLADAKKQASAEYERIVDEANGKADTIVEEAKKAAEAEKESILQQADVQLKDMVVTAAARIAGAGGADADRALYDRFLDMAGQPGGNS